MSGKSAAIVAVACVVMATVLVRGETVSSRIVYVKGKVSRCLISDAAIVIDVNATDATQHFRLSETDISWPSREYATVVQKKYAVSAPCPAVGTSIMVTQCEGCGTPTVGTVELSSGTSFQEATASLWIFRQFLDPESRGPGERDSEFLISKIISRHNRRGGSISTLWIRDRISSVLFAYSSAQRAESTIDSFGPPNFRKDVDFLTTVFQKHRNDVGLVKGRPYEPPDERSSPSVGNWGVFPTAVYLEPQARTLNKVFPAK